MTAIRIAEIISAIITGLLVIACLFVQPPTRGDHAGYILGWVLFFALPGAVVITGAYFQSVRNKLWGFALVSVMALLSAGFIVVSLFGGIFYWGLIGLFFLTPSMMVIVTAFIGLGVVLSDLPEAPGKALDKN